MPYSPLTLVRLLMEMQMCIITVLFICSHPIITCMYVSFRQGSSLLWSHMLRPFYSRPIALTQEGRSLVNDVCECVRD